MSGAMTFSRYVCNGKTANVVIATARLRRIPCEHIAWKRGDSIRKGIRVSDDSVLPLLQEIGLYAVHIAGDTYLRRQRPRDTQRSKVHTLQIRAIEHEPATRTPWKTLAECKTFAGKIWRSERGRCGLAGLPMPGNAPLRASKSLAHNLCALAYCLTPEDAYHGPRYVGVLIGLLARHCGHDANALMAWADELGVKYHVRSIGSVPVTETGKTAP